VVLIERAKPASDSTTGKELGVDQVRPDDDGSDLQAKGRDRPGDGPRSRRFPTQPHPENEPGGQSHYETAQENLNITHTKPLKIGRRQMPAYG
jgi:hypothetical protein